MAGVVRALTLPTSLLTAPPSQHTLVGRGPSPSLLAACRIFGGARAPPQWVRRLEKRRGAESGKGQRTGGQARCGASASGGAEFFPAESPEVPEAAETPQQQEDRRRSLTSMWKNWQTNASEMRAQVAKLGLAAVLAYGLFDGVTYTSFFVLAFLGYEKSTGQNPAANLKALLSVVILMWTGNNVTRPLRVAGAAALAPLIDRFLKKTQEVLKLPNQAFAFMIVVASFASLCFSVVGLLILSRWGK